LILSNTVPVGCSLSSTRGYFGKVPHALLAPGILELWNMVRVFAEWRLVDGHDRAKVYVDPEAISRHGEWVSVWGMDNLQTAQARGLRKYLSTRAQEEHDCAKERFRLLALEYFSGNMGSGGVLYKTVGESDWATIPRGTLAQSVWKFVCA
jgi:hypothetical protein